MKSKNIAINPVALKKAMEIDKKKKEKELYQEKINQQVKFAFDYKICPICSNKLKRKHFLSFPFALTMKLYCYKCKKEFNYDNIDRYSPYYY